MNSLIINHQRLLLLFTLFLASLFVNAHARPNIQTTLSTGSIWELSLNGEKDYLRLGRANTTNLTNNRIRLNSDFAWGGRVGQLIAFSDGKNVSQSIVLNLTDKNGVKVKCHGYIAQETGHFMAGTCGNRLKGDAWYATKNVGSNTQNNDQKQPQSSSDKPSYDCRYAVTELSGVKADIKRYQASLKQCRTNLELSSNTPSSKPFSSFKNKLDGTYYGFKGKSCDKCEDAPSALFPQNAAVNNEVSLWLKKHNEALLGLVYGVLKTNELNDFSSNERQECKSNDPYCSVVFRQRVISCALNIGC